MIHSPYSCSRLKCCLLRFQRKYIQKLDATTISAGYNLGKCYHEFVAEWLESKDKDIQRIGNKHISQYPTVISDEFWDMASRVIDSQLPDTGDFVFVEIKVGITENEELCDFDDKDCMFRGIIDLAVVNGDKLIIIDHKTTPKIASFGEVSTDIALLAYAKLMLAKGEFEDISIGLHFPRYNYTRMVKTSLEEVEASWRKVIYSIYERENRTVFPHQPSGECLFCEYRSMCVDDIKGFNNPGDEFEWISISDNNVRDKVRQQVLHAQSALRLSKEIKEYVNDNGDIDIARFELVTTKEIKDKETLFNLMVNNGIDPWQYLTITQSSIAKLAKRERIISDDVRAMFTDKISTRLKLGN